MADRLVLHRCSSKGITMPHRLSSSSSTAHLVLNHKSSSSSNNNTARPVLSQSISSNNTANSPFINHSNKVREVEVLVRSLICHLRTRRLRASGLLLDYLFCSVSTGLSSLFVSRGKPLLRYITICSLLGGRPFCPNAEDRGVWRMGQKANEWRDWNADDQT